MPAKHSADHLMQVQAFEYVTGTLRGREREDFKKHLAANKALQTEVIFWEEHFMALPPPEPQTPQADLWPLIEKRLAPFVDDINADKPKFRHWKNWLHWLAPSGIACLLLVVFGVYLLQPAPTNQYVAILTDANGNATLTASTQGEQSAMRMQWQPIKIPAGKNIQLWAISSRDHQPRSVAVFDDIAQENIALNTAQLRLIKDAEHLLLTEEEDGGSAVDEPSDRVLAKGVCVHIKNEKI